MADERTGRAPQPDTTRGHWRSLGDNDSDYLGAWDLVRGDATLEIAEVRSVVLPARGEVKGGRKPVIAFRGAKKKLIVGATIGKAIAGMYGNDVANWPGKRVTLFATTTKAKAGGIVDCVRVRPMIPRGPATGIDEQPVDQEMRERQRRGAGEPPPNGTTPREPGEEG